MLSESNIYNKVPDLLVQLYRGKGGLLENIIMITLIIILMLIKVNILRVDTLKFR